MVICEPGPNGHCASINVHERFREVDTKSVAVVRGEVAAIYARLFSGGQPGFIPEIFRWTDDAFAGRYANFQGIDAKYHDLEHTLQGTLCLARLLEGYAQNQAQPDLTRRAFELSLIAILLHDTGYLKRREDREGTGAKYTLTHVNRSADFAAQLLRDKGLPAHEIQAVQNMIRCTGLNADLRSIPFQHELERRTGFALGTADLLGQMAAPDYIDKLGILFQEFDEANQFTGRTSGPGVFGTVEELRRKTPDFWERYVLPKVNNDFQAMFRFLSRPYPNGVNPYLDRIHNNIQRLRDELMLQLA